MLLVRLTKRFVLIAGPPAQLHREMLQNRMGCDAITPAPAFADNMVEKQMFS